MPGSAPEKDDSAELARIGQALGMFAAFLGAAPRAAAEASADDEEAADQNSVLSSINWPI